VQPTHFDSVLQPARSVQDQQVASRNAEIETAPGMRA
jgi:hypothetical protein